MLLADYETEQSELELSVDTLEKALDAYQENADKIDKFIELVHRYTDFTELTTPMIHEFVDKIVVHEADKSTGDRASNSPSRMPVQYNTSKHVYDEIL